MSLQRRPTSNWWYGRWEVNGKTYCKNLGVEIKGRPPGRRGQPGDAAFEKSKGQAQAKLEELIAASQRKRQSEELLQSLHEIRSGHRVGSVKLDNLREAWSQIPRKRSLNPRYVKCCHKTLVSFTNYISEHHPSAAEMSDITREMAIGFLTAESARGITGKTWNDELKLLRATFKHLRRTAGLIDNPFEEIPLKESETVFRKPFSSLELKRILDASQEDSFTRPLIITAMCTAMRKGDCCRLKWSDVDMNSRFVTVKTTKTGVTVVIPMFPLLYDLLRDTPPTESQYCFPDLANMYESNPDGVTWRVRQILKIAGFSEPSEGDSENLVAKEESLLRIKRKNGGLRQASVRDLHSFRVTWITLALSAGVPMELVRKVTGHATVDIVLKHYFQPGRENMRDALNHAMPKMLMKGKHSDPKTEIQKIVRGITPKSLAKDKEKLLRLISTL